MQANMPQIKVVLLWIIINKVVIYGKGGTHAITNIFSCSSNCRDVDFN